MVNIVNLIMICYFHISCLVAVYALFSLGCEILLGDSLIRGV